MGMGEWDPCRCKAVGYQKADIPIKWDSNSQCMFQLRIAENPSLLLKVL